MLGSITDREALERALHSCDAVAHLAAVADVNDVHAEPEDAERVNARGHRGGARGGAARRASSGSSTRSTIWVYSDCESERGRRGDAAARRPATSTRRTKLAGELYCKAYQELYGIDYTILRFGIPYGPRAREAAVIPAFVNKALAGEPLTLAGDGGQSRRFVYVEDLADGVALGAGRRRGQPRLQPGQRRERDDQADRRDGPGPDRRRRDRLHARRARATSAARSCLSERAAQRAGVDAPRPRSPRASAGTSSGAGSRPRRPPSARRGGDPRRRARRRGQAPPGPDHLRRHRRGPRSPARAVAREFTDEDPDAQVSIVNGLPAMGPVLTKIAARELGLHVHAALPWLFDLQYRLFMYFAPTRWLARRLLTRSAAAA